LGKVRTRKREGKTIMTEPEFEIGDRVLMGPDTATVRDVDIEADFHIFEVSYWLEFGDGDMEGVSEELLHPHSSDSGD
jgi:hypothetical protein